MGNFWHQFIYPFLSSQATTAVVAIAAASGAFLIYFVRRRDGKKDAANIILLEIKNAERNLTEARKAYEEAKSKNVQAIVFPEKLRLMNTESWTKYKYLFVRDLSAEQWDEISKFYENCKNFDEAVELKDSAFASNASEIRVNIQQVVGGYSKEFADTMKPNPTNDVQINNDNQKLLEQFKQKKNAAVDAILRELVESYGPDKPFNDAAYYYNLLPKSLVNTPTGDRLKKLASRTTIFHRKNIT